MNQFWDSKHLHNMSFQIHKQGITIHLFRSSKLFLNISGVSLTLLAVAPGITWTMNSNAVEVEVRLKRTLDEER